MLREFKLVSATLTFGKRGTTVASWLFSPNKAKGAQMRDYTQLTSEERYQIEALLKADHNQTEIAAVLKRHKSTISREVGRDRGLRRGYRPKQAQQLTTKPPEFKGEAEDCPAEPGSGSRATARRGLEPPPGADQLGWLWGAAGAACESRSGSPVCLLAVLPLGEEEFLGNAPVTSNRRCTLVFLLPCDSPSGSSREHRVDENPIQPRQRRPNSRWWPCLRAAGASRPTATPR